MCAQIRMILLLLRGMELGCLLCTIREGVSVLLGLHERLDVSWGIRHLRVLRFENAWLNCEEEV